MSKILQFLTVISAILILPTNTANILAFFPSFSPSHLIIEMAVVNALVERNHNVTVMTVLPLQSDQMDSRFNHIQLKSGKIDMENLIRGGVSGLKLIPKTFSILRSMRNSFAEILDDPEFKEFLHNLGNKFDLLLHGYLMSDVLFGVAAHFDCPLALIWPNQPLPYILKLIGNPYETSYIPLSFLTDGSSDDKFGFKFRLINLAATTFDKMLMYFAQMPMKDVYESHFPLDKYPSYEAIKQSVALVLYAHHFSEKPIRPLVPGLIEIGGIQLNEKPNSLPKDINEFLAGASSEHGAIYFSLGTNIRNDHLQAGTLVKIFNVLSKLPQRVLWKCDNIGDVPGNSTNILYKKWLPQSDILGHPNMRLFFGHGGKGGITEAQFNGVPMVGLPFFADQPQNMDEVVRNGYGLSIDHTQPFTEEIIGKAVNEVLFNSKYKTAVHSFSKLYRDRPLSAKENAVYWLEYLIRHKGAAHMQSPLKQMNLVQTHNLDIFLFLFLSTYLTFKLIYFVGRILVKYFCRKSKTD